MSDETDLEATRRRRSVARLATLSGQGEERDLDGTTDEERFAMMWRLALDAWAFMGEPVEPRLPRHLVRIHRR
jgi:hypothetical protein